MLNTNEDKTQQFAKKYLVRGKAEWGSYFYGMMADSRGTDKKKLAIAIRRMDYDDFMETRYWRLVSTQVKRDSHWCCQECGRRCHDLEVHHESYKQHGYEMFHYKELRCLCSHCHRLKHSNK